MKVKVDDNSADYIVFNKTDGLCDDLSVFPIFSRIRTAVSEIVADFKHFF